MISLALAVAVAAAAATPSPRPSPPAEAGGEGGGVETPTSLPSAPSEAPPQAVPSRGAEAATAPASPTAPGITLAPSAARPGDAVLVRLLGAAGEPAPAGALAGRPLAFWRAGEEWRALAPLPIETPPGAATVEVEAGGARASAALEIVPPGFPSRSLTVPDRFVEPPAAVRKRIAADRAAFAKAYARPFAPPRFEGGFAWPREARLTGRFGDKRVFNGKRESIHYGTDVTGPVGSPIAAAADGEVVLARDCYMSGRTVLLWHGGDVFTAYFHLDRIGVRRGARVRRGEPVGSLGATGRVTGPHLHWSARVGGLYVDPESLLGIDFGAGEAPPREPRPGAEAAGEAGPAAAEAPALQVSPAAGAPAPPR